MEKEFNLSEKIRKGLYGNYGEENDGIIIPLKDVIQAVKLLKEELCFKNSVLDDEQEHWVGNKIDKIFGEKIAGEK